MNGTKGIVNRAIGKSSLANRRRKYFAALVALSLFSGLLFADGSTARAATTGSTWLGGIGPWMFHDNSGTGNWTGLVPPNNGGGITYNVLIDGGKNDQAIVTIDNIYPTISDLTVDGGNTLNVADNFSLTIAGGPGDGAIDNFGTINIGSTGNYTDIILSGDGATIVLSGGGTLAMSNNVNNRIYSLGAAGLTVNANNTIQGSGYLGVNSGAYGFTLTNNGTINANQSTPLQIAPTNTVINNGTLKATSGGTLNLKGVYTNTNGTILATGTNSVVNLGGSTINGGTLTTILGGVVGNDGTATLNGVTISGDSTFTALNNSSTTLQGTITIGSTATLALRSTGNDTDLILDQVNSPVMLDGGGTLSLANTVRNRIYGNAPGVGLTVNSGNTIEGSGQIGINVGAYAFTLTNNGTINANQSAALLVAPTNSVTNNGMLEATNGGTLNLIGTFSNAGGTILATGTNSAVNLNGATINGGTLTTTASGVIVNSGTATLNGVTISNDSAVVALDGSITTLQGTTTIAGSTAALALASTGNNTDLIVSGNVALTGGLRLIMTANINNRIYGSGSDTLTVGPAAVIGASGQIGINNGGYAFNLTNHGIIVSIDPSAALQIAPSTMVVNMGTLEAGNGAALNLIGAFNNVGGVIKAAGIGSVVNLTGSTISGGTLTTSSGGAINNNGNATLNGVTISGGSTVTAVDATTTTLQGTITFSGGTATFAQNSTGNQTDVILSGAVTLTGGGTFAMSNSAANRVYAAGLESLTNDAGTTIQGSGQIGVNSNPYDFTLTNKGTINANQPIAPTNTVVNTGTLEATNGGTLNLFGDYTNTGGLITAAGASSVVNLTGNAITGGTFTTATGGAIDTNGTVALDAVAISAGSTLTTQSGTTTITGSQDLGAGASFAISGGTVRFNVTSGSVAVGAGVTVTIASGATLELAGTKSGLAAGAGRASVINNSSTQGLLVTGMHQQVGSITGTGTTQVNAGSDLTANSIIQSALNIDGAAGNIGAMIIAASDASGNSLGQALAVAGNLGLAAGDVVAVPDVAESMPPIGGDSVLGPSGVGAGATAVPEPTTLLLALLGLASLGRIIHRRRWA